MTRYIEDFDQLDHITVTAENGVMCSTVDDPEMRPLDHRLYPNRHERRKAQALDRRRRRAIGADW